VISIAGRRVRRLHIAATGIAAVIVFSVFFMGSVSAYVGNSGYDVRLFRGSAKNCSDGTTVSVLVRDKKNHKPVHFQSVKWSFGKTKSSSDKLSARSTVTGKNGTTGVGVRFGPKAGTRTVYATVAGFRYTTTASCASAAKPTPKATKTPKPTQHPTATAKPTHKPTQPAQATRAPTPKPTKKPHRATPTPTPIAVVDPAPTPTAIVTTLPAGGISPSPSGTTTAVVDPGPGSSGEPAGATTNPQSLPPSDASHGGGGGFDFGLLALLVIGALGAVVVIFLIRQPTRVRR
jgi:hypothetical protein